MLYPEHLDLTNKINSRIINNNSFSGASYYFESVRGCGSNSLMVATEGWGRWFVNDNCGVGNVIMLRNQYSSDKNIEIVL